MARSPDTAHLSCAVLTGLVIAVLLLYGLLVPAWMTTSFTAVLDDPTNSTVIAEIGFRYDVGLWYYDVAETLYFRDGSVVEQDRTVDFSEDCETKTCRRYADASMVTETLLIGALSVVAAGVIVAGLSHKTEFRRPKTVSVLFLCAGGLAVVAVTYYSLAVPDVLDDLFPVESLSLDDCFGLVLAAGLVALLVSLGLAIHRGSTEIGGYDQLP